MLVTAAWHSVERVLESETVQLQNNERAPVFNLQILCTLGDVAVFYQNKFQIHHTK